MDLLPLVLLDRTSLAWTRPGTFCRYCPHFMVTFYLLLYELPFPLPCNIISHIKFSYFLPLIFVLNLIGTFIILTQLLLQLQILLWDDQGQFPACSTSPYPAFPYYPYQPKPTSPRWYLFTRPLTYRFRLHICDPRCGRAWERRWAPGRARPQQGGPEHHRKIRHSWKLRPNQHQWSICACCRGCGDWGPLAAILPWSALTSVISRISRGRWCPLCTS